MRNESTKTDKKKYFTAFKWRALFIFYCILFFCSELDSKLLCVLVCKTLFGWGTGSHTWSKVNFLQLQRIVCCTLKMTSEKKCNDSRTSSNWMWFTLLEGMEEEKENRVITTINLILEDLSAGFHLRINSLCYLTQNSRKMSWFCHFISFLKGLGDF